VKQVISIKMTERRNPIMGNIAYCGLACDACPIHWATIKDFPDKKIYAGKYIGQIASVTPLTVSYPLQ
jgi:hypothetical protein